MLLPLFPHHQKSHKFIYFAGTDDETTGPNTAEPKPETDAVQEWRALRAQEKPEQLKARIAKQIEERKIAEPSHLIKKMQAIVKGGNADEIAWIDEYFNSGKTYLISEFDDGIKAIREENEQNGQTNIIKSTYSAVMDNVGAQGNWLDTLKLGYAGQSRATIDLAHKYNEEDKVATKNLLEAITAHNSDFSKSDWDRLLRTSPHAGNYDTHLAQILGEEFCRQHPEQVTKIKKMHQIKHEAVQNFEKTIVPLFEKLDQEYEKEYYHAAKIKELELITGLPVKVGKEFEIIKADGSSSTAKIKKIKWENRLDEEAIHEITKGGNNVHDQIFIDLEIRTGGTTRTDELSFQKFIEWANENDQASEYFSNHKALEKALELDSYNQGLEPGLVLEYMADKAIDITTIEAIDPDNKTIRLSKAVPYYKETTKQELTFSEFAKWWRRYYVEQQMDVNKAQEILNQLPRVIKAKHPDLDEVNDQPIQLKAGAKIKNGKNGPLTINEVDANGVKLNNGQEIPLSQFVRTAKDNELEAHTEEAAPVDPTEQKPGEKPADAEVTPSEETKKDEPEPPPPAPQVIEELETLGSGDSAGFFQDIWNNITFLSGKDLHRITEVVIDYYTRNTERSSKRRVGVVGAKLPGRLGREFEVMVTESETETVNKYKSNMEQWSEWAVMDRMYATNNIDETKATLYVLSASGRLRFDDTKMWSTLNRLLDQKSGGYKYKLSISHYADNPNMAQDKVKAAMDFLWGENNGDSFYTESTNKFDSAAENFTKEARDYDNSFKGVNVAGELHNMLVDHIEGVPVKPQRYFAFLKYIMTAGKASIEDKFYYLFQGLYMKNSRGETLISSRLMSTLSELMNKLPYLNFLIWCFPFGSDSPKGNLAPEYLADVLKRFELKKGRNQKNGSDRYNVTEVNRYIWQDALMSTATINRVGRGSRGASEIDHDDAHFIIPLNRQGDMLTNVLGKQAGDRPNYTTDGLKNGVAGFNMMFAATAAAGSDDELEGQQRKAQSFATSNERLAEMVPAYIVFMNGLMGRVEGTTKQGPEFLYGTAPNDRKLTMREQFDEMNKIMKQVLIAYNFDAAYIHTLLNYTDNDTAQDNYKKNSNKIKDFGKEFLQKLARDDRGAKMVAIIRDAAQKGELSGISGMGKAMATQKDFGNYWRENYKGKPRNSAQEVWHDNI
ncbi:hypothetical protein COY06_03650 [Candidatus Peregrinibacteria bacterium CG_4_10_14_0_2_um_filter_41_8]|nr:MAG: hypothetical protein COY06_03650 [Candidatus Peregrinibacteria bacterium CG_4_10_14_0_2_um_filter_41_8]